MVGFAECTPADGNCEGTLWIANDGATDDKDSRFIVFSTVGLRDGRDVEA